MFDIGGGCVAEDGEVEELVDVGEDALVDKDFPKPRFTIRSHLRFTIKKLRNYDGVNQKW